MGLLVERGYGVHWDKNQCYLVQPPKGKKTANVTTTVVEGEVIPLEVHNRVPYMQETVDIQPDVAMAAAKGDDIGNQGVLALAKYGAVSERPELARAELAELNELVLSLRDEKSE